MNTRNTLSIALAAALFGTSFTSHAAAILPEGSDDVASSKRAKAAVERRPYYVRFGRGQGSEVEQAVSTQGGSITHRLNRFDTFAVMIPEAAAAALANRPDVALVEPVPEHKLLAQVVPWNIDQFQARDIWDKDRNGSVDAGAPNGSGVKFCIIDTGFYYDIDGAGPDLGHSDFVGVTANGLSQIPGEDWHFDGNGHGTHVAGTANAMNNNIGVVGVMPGGAELYIVKIFNNDGVWSPGNSNLGAAAEACRDAGANVLSMSLGGGSSATEEAIFQSLYDTNNIVNIAAAGNDGNGTASYPASYESVISVAAIDVNEAAADFTQYPTSAYGVPTNTTPRTNVEWDVVELAGGGVDVLSTVPSPDGGVPNYSVVIGSDRWDGTGISLSDTAPGVLTGAGTAELVSGGICDAGNAAWSGKVVLCQRGTVTFAAKVNAVESSGGVAAILYNNVATPLSPTCGGLCNDPAFPAVWLELADGQEIATRVGETAAVIADDGSNCTDCSGGYDFYSGTSMATPGVAAGVGFVWDACGGPSGITNKQLRQLLRDSTKDLTGTHATAGAYGAGWDRVTGWGLVQLADAQELGNTRFGSTCPIGLAVTPPAAEVCGLDGSTAFTVTLDDQFLGTANMSDGGTAPAGSSGSFSPNPVIHPVKDSVYTLSGLQNVASGVYDIDLTATDASDSSNTASGRATLSLFATAPGTSTLSSPGNGATDVALQPTLSWAAASEVSEYEVQVSTAADFSSFVYSGTTTSTSVALPSALSANTTYFWRVRATNVCGDAAWSTASFTTVNVVCQLITSSDVPKTLADATGGGPNLTPGVTNSVLSSSLAGTILDVNVVALNGTHTFINDLSFNLISPAATNVQIMARSCAAQDNFNLSLDDEAAGGAGGWPCPPTGGGSYRPSNPLSAFDGQASNGTWTLRVSDAVKNDTGALAGWGLNLCVVPAVVNQPPTANAQSTSVNEDSSVLVTLTGTDPESDPLTFAIAGGPSNGSLSGSGASRTYTPNANFNGADSFTFTVNDGTSTSAAATVSITVNAVNDTPVANAQSVSTNEDTALGITLTGTDVEGTALTYVVASGPSNGVLSGTVPNLTYTPNANFNGPDSFTFTVSDGVATSAAATVSITVNAVNDTPVANAQSTSTNEDTAVGITLTGSDVEGSGLTYAIASGPSNGVLGGTGASRTYTPNPNFNGNDSFTFTVNDGTSTSAAATVSITVNPVNDAPVVADQGFSVAEDASIGAAVGSIASSDPEGNSVSFVVTGGTGQALFAVAGNGAITVSAALAVGSYTLNVIGTDNGTPALADTAVITITVDEVNVAPVANAQSVSTDEDVAVAVTLTGSDANGDGLSYTVVSGPSNGVLSGTVPNLTYTPNANVNGPDSFTFTVSDGAATSAAATVSITVNAVNDTPVANAQSTSTNEDVAVGITLTGSDVEGSALTYVVASGPSNGVLSGTVPNLTYTPNANFNGPDSFTFTVSDGVATSAAATVSITVNAVNDTPVANAQSVSTNEDTALGVTLTGTDVEGTALTYVVASGPSNGVLSGTVPNLTYTPNANFNGPDSFTFTVSDGSLTSAAATVSITVNAVNDAPTTTGISNQANNEGDLVNLDVRGSFSDIDGGVLSFSTLSALPDGVSFANGVFSGTLSSASAGSYAITVTANDGLGGTIDAGFTWDVTDVAGNQAPVAAPMSNMRWVATDFHSMSLADFFTDPDGDTMTFGAIGLPASLSIDPQTGVMSGTLTMDDVGEYDIVFSASDGINPAATIAVILVVKAPFLFEGGFEDPAL